MVGKAEKIEKSIAKTSMFDFLFDSSRVVLGFVIAADVFAQSFCF